MSGDNTGGTENPTTEETPAEETTETTQDEVTEETEENPSEEGEKGDESAEEKATDLSHDDALAALKKARNEAARYRTAKRELEQKFKDAKTPDEVQAVIDELKNENAKEAKALLIENVALKHGLPTELADALKGETREELEAHAKVLAKYAPGAGEDPELEGGLDPTSNSGGNEDVADTVRRARARRY